MPGIFGAYRRNGKEKLGSLMERMICSMNYEKIYRVDQFLDEEKGLIGGRVSLGILNPVDQPVNSPKGDGWIIFHGELYRKPDGLSDPVHILNSYLEKGDQCATELNGVFHFVIYNRRLNQIKLFSDKFGLQPLYYSVKPDGIIFAGEVKGILADSLVSREADYKSFADFFHFGQILGNKTLFKKVKLLPPASTITYDLKNGLLSEKCYWDLEEAFSPGGNYDPGISPDEVVSLLVESIKERGRNTDILGLSISAGLDSRGILAGLKDVAKGLHTYTLGLPGCADQRLADQLARAAGTKHEFVPMERRFLENYENVAASMIFMSDGMYHPYESTEMLALEYFKKSQFKILLRGHGGEIAKAALAHPVMVTPAALACKGSSEILDFIFGSTNLVLRDIDPKKMFSPSFRDYVMSAPRSDLEKSCGRASWTLAPGDVCIFYYMREHIRRQVVSSLEIFRTQIEIRMPYIDGRYIEKLLKLPFKARNEGEIQLGLIRRCMPSLIRIPNSNTGAPLDSGPLRLFIMDKFNSLMKRLSIKGFRHYTEFNKWYRDIFKEISRHLIFHEKTKSRNLYDMEFLEQVFNTHMSGARNYGRLLGTIVGLELWFRKFMDSAEGSS